MIVTRDFNGLLIPSAAPILILAGTTVEITQNKGGFVTIYANGNLVRVERRDFGAIGLEVGDDQIPIIGPISVELAWQVLRECYDPEIPINIVDLGLVYDCSVVENKITVTMTLTAPMCGMGPILISDIKARLLEIKDVKGVEVNMVFDPPWTKDRMSDAAKLELGLI